MLKVEMSEEKTKLTYLKKDKAKFLGTYITLKGAKEAKVVEKKVKGQKLRTRISQVRQKLLAPMMEILEKLEKKGFIKRDSRGKMIPNSMNP